MLGIYFSGTGNSRYALEVFLSRYDETGKMLSLEDESVVNYIENNEGIVFAYSVQYSNIPKILQDFVKKKIGIYRLIFHQPLYFQEIFAVKCQILMFCPYQPKQGQIFYCPTTISSSFSDFFFASLVAWAYTFIVVLTSECPRSSCTSFGCAPFSNRFVV